MLKLSRRDFIETTLFDDGKILTINSLSRHADISIDEANELVYFVSFIIYRSMPNNENTILYHSSLKCCRFPQGFLFNCEYGSCVVWSGSALRQKFHSRPTIKVFIIGLELVRTKI